jgi:lipopolysaccharide transport system permease protein
VKEFMSTIETLDSVTRMDSPSSGERLANVSVEVPAEVTVIEPISNKLSLNLREVWRYRDLLSLLILRDLSARYRQSIAGFSWALIKPLTSMLIFTLIFSRVAKIPSDGSPYPLFVLAGIIPWFYFSNALSGVTNSVVGSGSLLTKVYFPRLILPLVTVAAGLVEVLVQLAVIFVMMWWYGINPGLRLAFIPVLILYTAAAALSVGLWMTAMNVKYRDVGLAAPFLIQCGMWLSPVVYSSGLVSEKWRLVYGLNPMVGVIEGFRWVFTGRTEPDWMMMGISASVVTMLLVGGLAFFRKTELTFADVI